jgi:tetratricopeptide (TPR) repeat protein
MPGKSLLSIRVPLIALVAAIGLIVTATPAAWSQSPSASGGTSQPPQVSSGSGDNDLTMDSSDFLPFDDSAADLASCDKDAANPSDPKRPSGVAGVAFNKIDTKHAIEDCGVALKSNPNEPRAKYELGRAFEAGKQYDKAWTYFHSAAGAGYAAAMASIGRWYEHGIGQLPLDRVAAEAWYKRAVDAGDDAVRSDLTRLKEALSSRATPGKAAVDRGAARTSSEFKRPDEVIEAIYRSYGIGATDDADAGFDEVIAKKVLEPRLLRIYLCAINNQGLDADFFVQAQDFNLIAPIKITKISVAGSSARIKATLVQAFGGGVLRRKITTDKFTFYLVRGSDGWRLHDAMSNGNRLSHEWQSECSRK